MEVPPGPLEEEMEVTRAGVLRGWGLGRAVQAEDWQKAWPPVLLQPVDRWGLSAARRETLASGWHRDQIRP